MSGYAKLFEPFHIGKMILRNRIVMSPMGTFLGNPDGSISPRQIHYFAERARGGAGLIISEVTKVDTTIETPAPALNQNNRFDLQPGMSQFADIIHTNGAKVVMQLSPGFGRFAVPPVAPSAIPLLANPAVKARELTLEEIKTIITAFGMAAGRAARAGYDAIEVHGHAGYLCDQFMTSLWNLRTDEYGGDLDGRMRFPIELVQAARKQVGPDFPILFRYSAIHHIPGGRTLEEGQEIAKRLEAAGVDALDIADGSYETFDSFWPNTYHMAEAPFVDLAAAIKSVVSIPVMVSGNMTPEAGEAALEAGKVDLIMSGRDMIADPEWPNKVKEGRRSDVRSCIRCNQMCLGRTNALKSISCSINARAGFEWYYDMHKSETPKEVLVIGGGPAGLEAARVAALRGHHVTLVEKENTLGGQITAAATPPFKQALRQQIDWWTKQLENLKVNVKLNTEVTSATLENFNVDAVVVASGALPIWLPIPGIDGENVVEILDYHLGKKQIHGQNIIIAGGGLSGCDAALDLAMEGKKVTIVEMLDDVALGLNRPARTTLLRRLGENDVKILTKHKVKEFKPGGLVVQEPTGEESFIEGDTVVIAFGTKPNDSLVKAVEEKWTEVYVVGDCSKVATMGDAVHAGFGAGWKL